MRNASELVREVGLPDDRETTPVLPRPPPVGHCARGGTHTVLVEGRLRISVLAPASLPSCRPDRARSRPEFSVSLGDKNSSDGVQSVSLLPERKRQFAKPSLYPIRFDVREILPVYTRCALVRAALGVSVSRDVLATILVVRGVETIAGFCLRFRVHFHCVRAFVLIRGPVPLPALPASSVP
jgi:hypothetical protein